MVEVFVKGFVSGGSLIAAIGAQNAFVLSRGIKKSHVLIIPLICFLCDVIFIGLGVSGMGVLFGENSFIKMIVGFLGGGFLFFYGLSSLLSAFKDKSLDADENIAKESFIKVIAATLGVTLLNPHFYLDTVFLLGSISSHIAADLKIHFYFGAITASFIWFFCLSMGASFLRPFFKKEISWKILDIFVACIMFYMGFFLVKDYF